MDLKATGKVYEFEESDMDVDVDKDSDIENVKMESEDAAFLRDMEDARAELMNNQPNDTEVDDVDINFKDANEDSGSDGSDDFDSDASEDFLVKTEAPSDNDDLSDQVEYDAAATFRERDAARFLHASDHSSKNISDNELADDELSEDELFNGFSDDDPSELEAIQAPRPKKAPTTKQTRASGSVGDGLLSEKLAEDELPDGLSDGDPSEPETIQAPRPKKAPTTKQTRASGPVSDGLLSDKEASDISDISCPIFARICKLVFLRESAAKGRVTTQQALGLFRYFGASKVWSWIESMLNSNPRLRKVIDEELWTDVDALQAIGGDLGSTRARWYANIVTDSTSPDFLKMYFGQAVNLGSRMNGHIRNLVTPNNTQSLHYFIATKKNRVSGFITIGMDDIITEICTNHPGEHLGALMIVVEHYLCCLFQTLPKPLLQLWLPGCITIRDEVGLNLQPPVGPLFATTVKQLALEYTDPEIQSFFKISTKTVLNDLQIGFDYEHEQPAVQEESNQDRARK